MCVCSVLRMREYVFYTHAYYAPFYWNIPQYTVHRHIPPTLSWFSIRDFIIYIPLIEPPFHSSQFFWIYRQHSMVWYGMECCLIVVEFKRHLSSEYERVHVSLNDIVLCLTAIESFKYVQCSYLNVHTSAYWKAQVTPAIMLLLPCKIPLYKLINFKLSSETHWFCED